MLDLSDLRQHAVDPPPNWNPLGDRVNYLLLPLAWQEQIMFLDQAASDQLYAYFNATGLHTGRLWEPFAQQNFRYQSPMPLLPAELSN